MELNKELINIPKQSQLIFSMEQRQVNEDVVFSTNDIGKTGHQQEIKI